MQNLGILPPEPADTRSPSIKTLLRSYVVDNGSVTAVTIDSAARTVVLDVDCPLDSGHADYSPARRADNLRKGTLYSDHEWRRIEIACRGVIDLAATLGAAPLPRDVRVTPQVADIEVFEIEHRRPVHADPSHVAVHTLTLIADDLIVFCLFEDIVWREHE